MKRDTLDDAPASGSVGPSGSSSTDVTVLPRSNRPLYLLGAVLGFGLFLVVLNFDDSGAEPQTIDPEVEGAARPAATPELAKVIADAAANAKLTPASPKWADVEAKGLLQDFFVKVAQGGDVKALATELDTQIESILNG